MHTMNMICMIHEVEMKCLGSRLSRKLFCACECATSRSYATSGTGAIKMTHDMELNGTDV